MTASYPMTAEQIGAEVIRLLAKLIVRKMRAQKAAK